MQKSTKDRGPNGRPRRDFKFKCRWFPRTSLEQWTHSTLKSNKNIFVEKKMEKLSFYSKKIYWKICTDDIFRIASWNIIIMNDMDISMDCSSYNMYHKYWIISVLDGMWTEWSTAHDTILYHIKKVLFAQLNIILAKTTSMLAPAIAILLITVVDEWLQPSVSQVKIHERYSMRSPLFCT